MSTPVAVPQLSPEYLAASKGPTTLALGVSFPAVALLVVGLRLYTRFSILKKPSREDFAIALAMMFSIACMICQIFQIKYGVGRHVQALSYTQIVAAVKALWVSTIFYGFAITLTKISIALQYLRLDPSPAIYRTCWGLIWLTAAVCTYGLFAGIFVCTPVAKFWNIQLPGKCINRGALYYSVAAISIVQDILLVTLPFFILRRLNRSMRQRVVLATILGLGGIAAVASVFRLYTLYVLDNTKDITWDSPSSAIWSTIELNIGIMCASLATLRPFFNKIWQRASSITSFSWGSAPNSSNKTEVRFMDMEGTTIVKNSDAASPCRNESDAETARACSDPSWKKNRLSEAERVSS